MKVKITLILESKGFNEKKEFSEGLTDVLCPYFDSGEVVSVKEIK